MTSRGNVILAFSVVAVARCWGIIPTQAASSGLGPLRSLSWQASLSCVSEACRLFLIQKTLRAKAVNYRFKIFEGQDGQTYVTIRHVNGQALYTSEGYTTRQAAVDTLENFIRGVRAVDLYRGSDEIVARYTTSDADVQS